MRQVIGALGVWLLAVVPGHAATVNFTATIDGAQETPPNASAATGTGTFVMDTDANTLSMSITYSGIANDDLLPSHIHGFAGPGAPAGIVYPFANSTSPINEVWNFMEAQQANIIAGLTYVNIHSAAFPAGEIRGQIVRTPACGDTVIDPGETCDDGNLTPGDGCDETCQAEAVEVGITAKKFIVIDKLSAASKAKGVFVAKDANVDKGPGTSVDDIDVRLDVVYDSASGAFVVPAGASDGTSGWLVNKETVAKFVNKSAPAGPTVTKVAAVKPGKLAKLVAKERGDTPLDVLGAGAPSGSVFAAYTVTNGGAVFRHCTEFQNAACAYKLIAGDTGAKLVCKGGTPDATCAAAP